MYLSPLEQDEWRQNQPPYNYQRPGAFYAVLDNSIRNHIFKCDITRG